jgi:hypothetical protein
MKTGGGNENKSAMFNIILLSKLGVPQVTSSLEVFRLKSYVNLTPMHSTRLIVLILLGFIVLILNGECSTNYEVLHCVIFCNLPSLPLFPIKIFCSALSSQMSTLLQ